MQLLNKFFSQYKNYLEKISDLSLAESAIPIPLPFLKIGLTNAVLLYALKGNAKTEKSNFKDFLLLALAKSVISNLYSGLLLTPFFLSSLFSSLTSASLMYIVDFCFCDFVSLYGVSILGSAVSVASQILILRFVIAESVSYFLPIMLCFSVISGAITVFIAQKLQTSEHKTKNFSQKKHRIKILPYFFLFIFIVLQCVFYPCGKVLFTAFGFSITQSSLITSLKKAFRLLALAIVSRIVIYRFMRR